MAALLPASPATFSWKPPATGSESATQAHCLSEQEGELPGASGLRGKGPPLPEPAFPRNVHSGAPRAEPHTAGITLQPV